MFSPPAEGNSDIQQIQEDLIQEKDGLLHAYEIKWKPNAKTRLSKTFSNNYPNHTFTIIHQNNYTDFLV